MSFFEVVIQFEYLHRCKGNALGQKYFVKKKEYVRMSGLFISFVRRFKMVVNFDNQKANNDRLRHRAYAHDDIQYGSHIAKR